MDKTLTTIITIAIIAAMTWVTRALPHIVFGRKKKLPDVIVYLQLVFPAATMMIILIYCLKNITFTQYPYGLAEFISIILVGVVQAWKKKLLLSITLGTLCYMILIRTIFLV